MEGITSSSAVEVDAQLNRSYKKAVEDRQNEVDAAVKRAAEQSMLEGDDNIFSTVIGLALQSVDT